MLDKLLGNKVGREVLIELMKRDNKLDFDVVSFAKKINRSLPGMYPIFIVLEKEGFIVKSRKVGLSQMYIQNNKKLNALKKWSRALSELSSDIKVDWDSRISKENIPSEKVV